MSANSTRGRGYLAAMLSATRCVYLSGLGTGTRSAKADALANWLEPRGVPLQVVDLRVPDFRAMRVPAMVEAATAALGGPGDRVVVIGTSLGGYVAARLVTEPRVAGVLLLAPVLEAGVVGAGHPGLARGWRALGWVPWWDKTERRVRAVGASLLDDLDTLAPPPPPGQTPVAIVHGRADRQVRVASSRRYAATHPGVVLAEVDDGHDLLASMSAVVGQLQLLLPCHLA